MILLSEGCGNPLKSSVIMDTKRKTTFHSVLTFVDLVPLPSVVKSRWIVCLDGSSLACTIATKKQVICLAVCIHTVEH